MLEQGSPESWFCKPLAPKAYWALRGKQRDLITQMSSAYYVKVVT